MLGDGSTAATPPQCSASGRANRPAPAPTSMTVWRGSMSSLSRLRDGSMGRRGSSRKRSATPAQWSAGG